MHVSQLARKPNNSERGLKVISKISEVLSALGGYVSMPISDRVMPSIVDACFVLGGM